MSPTKFVKLCQSLYGPSGWQGQLAEAVGVDPSSVRRWTSGVVPVPGPVAAYLNAKKEIAALKEKYDTLLDDLSNAE